MTERFRAARLAGITVLLVISAVMVASLFTLSAPHPPATIPFFALGPFFAASLGLGAAALILTLTGSPGGGGLALAFALTGLLSFGPQKFADPSFALIWPAVVTAQVAILAILISLLAGRSGRTLG